MNEYYFHKISILYEITYNNFSLWWYEGTTTLLSPLQYNVPADIGRASQNERVLYFMKINNHLSQHSQMY